VNAADQGKVTLQEEKNSHQTTAIRRANYPQIPSLLDGGME
jgi:hypothetical protein